MARQFQTCRGLLESLARHTLGRVRPGYAVLAVCLAGALSKFLS
ncbi:hypothetical protein ABZZ80_16880 [Streptomyces sp. NPDC006356]